MAPERDPHSGPVSEAAWAADAEARSRGRVMMFNATRPDDMDGWTMAIGQYELMREHILDMGIVRPVRGAGAVLPS